MPPTFLIALAAAAALFLSALFLPGCSEQRDGAPRNLTPAERHGQRLFAGACAVCHRADSTEPLNGPGLKGLYRKEYLPSGLKVSDQQVLETIKHGRKNMPPLGGLMNDQQLQDLIAYLKTL